MPESTVVGKIVPKNAFDSFTNKGQKKLLSEKVQRIFWSNRIAYDNVYLQGKDVVEIQVFQIILKEKAKIKEIISFIERAIPYNIIFWVEFMNEFYISTSVKHSNPQNENQSVIDYTFTSDWKLIDENPYVLELKNNLDLVFERFCNQLKSIETDTVSIKDLVEKQKSSEAILRQIKKLTTEINRCQQFNRKVELNMKLKELQSKLKFFKDSGD
ncbi:MAG: hypothetical protein UZ08_BCD001002394 [Candidatus Parvibacillus calidus]|nr:MAG: hypothetical protein UZ08_BCD001002394 [Candidatus Parvibacillus calidus]